MTFEQIASALWRNRLLFVLSFLVCLGGVIAVTLSLPKTYKSSATIYVGANNDVEKALALDPNLAEQLTRTYTALASNPNVADEVRGRLGTPLSRSALLQRMSFAPVEQTQLLEVSAEASSGEAARDLANTYATVFSERVDAQFAQGKTQSRISVSEPAVVPDSPAKPNPPLYIGLGGLLALALALGVALLRDRLDDRVQVSEDDDAVLGEPVVGRIPEISGRGGDMRLEVNDSFRVLKTNIDFFDDHPAQVLLVTSPSSGEGKSTVCAWLALTSISDGERVALIEGDLRRPGLSQALPVRGLDHSRVGLTNYLTGAADEQQIVTPQPELPGLNLIWAGPLPPNPSSLLRSHRLSTLIDSLRVKYDRIIIDSPPVSVGADASVTVPHVDGTLVVMDSRRTKRSSAKAGLNQLEKARARLLGVVLNREPGAGRDGYDYYGKVGIPEAPSRRSARRKAGV